MRYEERVPDELFEGDKYLGRPADFTDKIIERRCKLVEEFNDFIGKDKELLDIGCGNGASVFMLAPKMKHCLGIDINEKNKEEFEKYKSKTKIDNCDFKLFDIDKDNLPKQFDRIISFEVIEHLPNEKSVKFYYDSLKDDGLIAITVPNKWWIFETHGAKLPLLPWNRVPFFSWLPKFIHERYSNARIYTKSRITKLLESVGFEILSTAYITAPMDVLKEGRFKNFVVGGFFNSDTTSIPFKSTSILVFARKKKKSN
ncbi:MAG: class I SAM-dependent methyltransferase [Bacteroidetes bacterium]|nr:class I SAM-dependent methyltransferase [Bacteroidota bacterium]